MAFDYSDVGFSAPAENSASSFSIGESALTNEDFGGFNGHASGAQSSYEVAKQIAVWPNGAGLGSQTKLATDAKVLK